MSEPINEPTPEIPQDTPDPTPQAPSWSPSQDEFRALQEQNQRLASQLEEIQGYFAEPEPAPQDWDLTDPQQLAYLVGSVVDERLKSVTPYVKTAAQDQGKREMNRMFDISENELKDEFPAGFDRDLAERTAFYFFDQSGDAEGSVKEAARYAAQVRQQDRDAALEEARSRATRSGRGASDEPGAGASAVPGKTQYKTYDEVIEAYAHQTEV